MVTGHECDGFPQLFGFTCPFHGSAVEFVCEPLPHRSSHGCPYESGNYRVDLDLVWSVFHRGGSGKPQLSVLVYNIHSIVCAGVRESGFGQDIYNVSAFSIILIPQAEFPGGQKISGQIIGEIVCPVGQFQFCNGQMFQIAMGKGKGT